jgi:hypothetical protein
MSSLYPYIRKRFPKKEYALMQEVRDKAGFDASRSADAIAMCLWPSRGLVLHGFEEKVSRNDWLRELKQPKKAEAVFKYCDFFWLVTSDDKIAKLEEIPATWGWLCVKGDKLKTMKEAPKLTPEPLHKSFVACMLKRISEGMIHPSEIEGEIKIAKEATERNAQWKIDLIKKELDEIKKTISEFEEAAGVKMGRRYGDYSPKIIGEAIKLIGNGGVANLKFQLSQLKNQSEAIAKRIADSFKEFETISE